ncbi:unnamed protein product [Brachionus calyciflorus]|uniref:Uncharacterized protein n=1 Tax=Brachionus calyciflorus TaxID=104777 RepID=A0A814PHE5_9BILA|nr:unnamed protein product [Brachionus calyciflorus]
MSSQATSTQIYKKSSKIKRLNIHKLLDFSKSIENHLKQQNDLKGYIERIERLQKQSNSRKKFIIESANSSNIQLDTNFNLIRHQNNDETSKLRTNDFIKITKNVEKFYAEEESLNIHKTKVETLQKKIELQKTVLIQSASILNLKIDEDFNLVVEDEDADEDEEENTEELEEFLTQIDNLP